MARRVFFSFHYQRDLWRVNQIRMSHVVEGTAAAGFQDASLWEETKKKGDAAVEALIDKALVGTSVTVVLIGSETAQRKYVKYEIEQSVSRGNGLLGIYVHQLKDQEGKTSAKGAIPDALVAAGAPVYDWDRKQFGKWVEEAAQRADQINKPDNRVNYPDWYALGFLSLVIAALLWFFRRGGGASE